MALGRKYKFHPGLAPIGTVDDLLALAQWSKPKGCVLVVGHQPMLGQTIAHLLGVDAGDWSVKKGAVWWLRRRDPVDTGSTVVVTVQTPEMV
jgi:phosphohistidine phosphatase